MSFATLFACDNVELSTDTLLGSLGGHDSWHSVKISLQEIGLNNCWMYIELKGSTPPVLPILHIALTEGWGFSCDERAMTLVLHGQDTETLAIATQKLRFNKATDFWSFMFQFSLNRVRGYSTRERRD